MVSVSGFAKQGRFAGRCPQIHAGGVLPVPLLRLVVVVAACLLLCAPLATAAPASAAQARQVAQSWLLTHPSPLNAPLGTTVTRVDTFNDATGQPEYYIVYLDPSGFLIVSADDLLEPVVGFVAKGTYDPSPDNNLGALVTKDMPARLAVVRSGPSATTAAAQRKWAQLSGTPMPPPLAVAGSVSDLRVAPLVQSKWSQATAGDDPLGPNCYNYYTPNNSVCGCVATAMAQLMRYWQFPKVEIGMRNFSVTVNGFSQIAITRGGDGRGGPYDWDNMPFTTSAGTSTVQCQAIGALCYDAGLSVSMMYTLNLSGAYMSDCRTALTNTFGYANAVFGGSDNTVDIGSGLTSMINPNLDAGCPCLLGIFGSGGGHAIVVDGYGYSGTTLYHHLNMGWSGMDDAWYNLPMIDTSWVSFPIVSSCIYNIFTSGNGEIISGRVLDTSGNPCKKALVVAQSTTGTSYKAITNDLGIYALKNMPSGQSFTIGAQGSYISGTTTVSTGTSRDNATVSGDVWGVNFTAVSGGAPSVCFPAPNTVVNRDDGVAAIPVVLTGTNNGSLTVKYATSNGTAVSGTDYTATSGTITFQPYDVDATINIPLASDLYDPDSKTLTLTLSNAGGGLALGNPSSTVVTIMGSQTKPVASVASIRQPEGNSGTTPFNFTVTLSKRSKLPVTIDYQTVDDTATAGRSYTATSGTLTIPAGQTTGTITVPVIGDTEYELTESFWLGLSNPTGATLDGNRAQATIADDDPQPTISLEDASGCAPAMNFKVDLSGTSAFPIKVNYQTADGTAIDGTHYSATDGVLTILPGQASATISVPLLPAPLHEADRTFSMTLTNPTGATISHAHATGTVVCDIPKPTVSIEDGVDMGRFMSFQVQLSAGSTVPVILSYATADGTAVAGQEYTPVSETLTIPAGQKVTTIVVPIVTHAAQAKSLYVKTGSLINASAATSEATGIIQPADEQSGNGTITPSTAISCGAGAGQAVLFCCAGLGALWLGRGSSTIRRRHRK